MKNAYSVVQAIRHLTALALVITAQAATAAPGETTRISVDTNGVQANNRSFLTPNSGGSAISADGRYVTFSSEASNLVANDVNGRSDVFLRDSLTGSTTLVSVAIDGGMADGDSSEASISANGRYVTFSSEASNLVATETAGVKQVFVRDLQAGSTALVSVAIGGGGGNGASDEPSITADGRHVAFASYARNLVADAMHGMRQVFVRDLQAGSTELASVAVGGGGGDGYSQNPALSADGHYVAFASDSTDIVDGDTNWSYDIFVRDLQAASTALITVARDGGATNRDSLLPSMSGDGRYVAFTSFASNIFDGDTNGEPDVFVRDRQTGVITRVSVSAGGGLTDSNSFHPSLSADGRYVSFYSEASNLVENDTNRRLDVFVRDLQAGSTTLVTVATDGGVGNSFSGEASISADGRYVAFWSDASNLVEGDTNGAWDVFVHELASDSGLSLSLSKPLVAGCKSVLGKVTLPSPAPTGGLILSVSDTLAAATPPATVKVAEGATTKSFTIKTAPVASNQSGAVTVSLGGASASQPLTIRPMGLLSVTLKPTTVAGSQPVAGTAKLECDAGPGPITVDLSSSRPSVAYPVATNVVIPQGVRSQPFTVATNAVLAKTYAMITGEANGTTKTRKLNVTPAAEVSPRSLKFGNVAVGTTSSSLATTLTNKGTSAFVVDSIGITGSYASWFSQTNNCPSSLPAGGTCTITVKFKPAFAAKKSAKLSIVTSATSTPLSVSLSGTGI